MLESCASLPCMYLLVCAVCELFCACVLVLVLHVRVDVCFATVLSRVNVCFTDCRTCASRVRERVLRDYTFARERVLRVSN